MKFIRRAILLFLLLTGCQLSQAAEPTVTQRSASTSSVSSSATQSRDFTQVVQRTQPEGITDVTAETVAENPTDSPTIAPNPDFSIAAGASAILAWSSPSNSPDRASGGQVVLINDAGAVQPLIDLPNTTFRVAPCGDQATSPDGRFFAFYAGGDSGNLYLMDGTQAPVSIAEMDYLACIKGFRFAPNSQRFAFIDYAANATRNDFPEGILKVYTAETQEEIAHFDHVTAFDMDNGGAVFVSFYTNDRGLADEAAVNLWDGNQSREIVTLVPTEPNCRFTSGQIGLEQSNLLVVLGQRCSSGDTHTRWQLYSVDAVMGSSTLIATDNQPGAFASFARTNNLFFAPNDSTAYFTVPDSITAYTVAVAAVNLSDFSISVPVENQAVFPNFSGAADAFPRLSPDGRWLALVVTSPNNLNQLLVLDLNAPDSTPLKGADRSRGDTIPSLAFAPDGSKVIYVAGGNDNALFTLDLGLGVEQRVVRGNFIPGMAVSPDGKTVALLNTMRVEDERQPPYLDLVLANLDSGQLTTLSSGADIEDGKVNNLRFAFPLAWR